MKLKVRAEEFDVALDHAPNHEVPGKWEKDLQGGRQSGIPYEEEWISTRIAVPVDEFFRFRLAITATRETAVKEDGQVFLT